MSKKKDNSNNQHSRRDFFKISAAAGLGAAMSGTLLSNCSRGRQVLTSEPEDVALQTSEIQKLTSEPVRFTVPPLEKVRMGFVGVGSQGSNHVRNFLSLEGVEVKALCDIKEDRAKSNQDRVVQAGQPQPEIYTLGETDFKRLCERDDLDLVFIATSWEWHVPVAVAAMEAGKHAAIEVPAAITLDQCWQTVEMSEKMKRHC
ncbi:hypothetical protein AMJ80_08195, partial [bacterium SM23_31]